MQTVDLALKQGGSFAVELHGYIARIFELPLDELAAVEVWRRRTDNDTFNDNISFLRKVRDVDALSKPLIDQFNLVEGDSGSTFEVLYKYYLAKSHVLASQLSKLLKGETLKKEAQTMSAQELHWVALNQELNNVTLKQFFGSADKIWEKAIVSHYKRFHTFSDELIPDSKYVELYDEMAEKFPLHADAILNISINNLFWEKARRDDNTLASQKKVVADYFFALCRARNKEHMIHWAIVENLAIFGKGISQVTTRSTAGKNFCCALEHVLCTLDAIHEECQPGVKDMLCSEPMISFVLDNYQRSIAKLCQTGGQASLFHKATASSVTRHKVYAPPLGSHVKSPSGIIFKVTS